MKLIISNKYNSPYTSDPQMTSRILGFTAARTTPADPYPSDTLRRCHIKPNRGARRGIVAGHKATDTPGHKHLKKREKKWPPVINDASKGGVMWSRKNAGLRKWGEGE